MNIAFKFLLILLGAAALGYINATVSNPPASAATLKYQQDYQEKLSDEKLTPNEYDELKKREQEYIEELKRHDNVKESLFFIIKRKAVIIPALSILWFVIGYAYGFNRYLYIAITSASVLALSLLFINAIESIVYAASFLLGNVFFIRRKLTKEH